MKKVLLVLLALALLGLFACTAIPDDAATPAGSSLLTDLPTSADSPTPQPTYRVVARVTSAVDFNANGVDDYTDLLQGAKIDAQNSPRYDARYWQGGYPPEDIGVCTDLVWRAFAHAGYDLKTMVDKDIAANTSLYPRVNGPPDPNIDFRRTINLAVFFKRHAQVLTTDTTQVEQWQPGDIVTFGTWHSAMVSDRRTPEGRPYLLHNMGQRNREEDALEHWEISGHFRFDATQIPQELLAAFEGT